MLSLAEAMEFTPEGYAVRTGEGVHPIPELPDEATACGR